MRHPDTHRRLATIAQFARSIEASDEPAIALLVVRLPALERTAWREGLRKARTLERRACAAFADAAARVIRSGDTLAHDPGTDVFLAALTEPMRAGGGGTDAIDARSALARMAATMEGITGLQSETGWTVFAPSLPPDGLDAVIERAMRRGAQERERYSFFSAIGHELRTPLASIRGYLETLLDEKTADATVRRRFLTIAYNESLRLGRLVEGMFEISLLDLHATFPRLASGSLEQAITAAIDACSARAHAREVTLEREPTPPIAVAMDVDRLTLVIINLLENAIKHGRAGGRLAITFDCRDQARVQLLIDDDGPGIPAAERDRLFALGERGQTRAAGSGIGLALVRLMVERIGGRVWADASPLGGARFIVVVPAVEPYRVV